MIQDTPYILIAIIMFFIAAMSGLGVGSGGLLVIFLTSYFKLAPTDARVTNLLFFIISSSGALLIHALKRRIKFKLVLCAAALGILGTLIGTSIGKILGDTLLKFLFGIMLVISGGGTIFGKKIKEFTRILSSIRKKTPSKL